MLTTVNKSTIMQTDAVIGVRLGHRKSGDAHGSLWPDSLRTSLPNRANRHFRRLFQHLTYLARRKPAMESRSLFGTRKPQLLDLFCGYDNCSDRSWHGSGLRSRVL